MVEAVITKGVDGNIGWGVLGIGAKLESATTQVLKLQLEPLYKSKTGDYTTDFTVASRTWSCGSWSAATLCRRQSGL